MIPKRTRILTNVVVLALIGMTLIPEYGSDLLELTGINSRRLWSRVFEGTFWYQPLVTAGYRKPRNRFVRIVTLSDQREPTKLFADICLQRIFMARLLHKLQDAGSALVVLDKYFSLDSCPDPQDPGNQALNQAISTSKVPIVVGLHTITSEQLKLRRNLSEDEERALEATGLVLSPALHFDAPSREVHYGLIRLNRDNRKIPLEWPVYRSLSELAAPQPKPDVLPTLSRAAAEQYDPSLSSDFKFKELLTRGAHPYTAFLTKEEIVTFSALDLLCGPKFSQTSDWQHCEPSDYQNEAIHNHIVVVGNSTDDEDAHPSVLGVVPGVVLQANYIESLLDDRYLRPVPPLWNAAINLSALVLIGSLFVLSSTGRSRFVVSPERAAIASLCLTLLLWGLSYLIVLHLGYYLAVWFPGLYVLGMWAHTRLEKMKHRNQQKEGNNA